MFVLKISVYYRFVFISADSCHYSPATGNPSTGTTGAANTTTSAGTGATGAGAASWADNPGLPASGYTKWPDTEHTSM